jgi:hypothetical protein
MSIPDWRIIFVTNHAKGSPVVCSSLDFSIMLRMCLHRQNDNLMTIAYKNWALFRISSLLWIVGNRLCWTIFASKRCREEKELILMFVCDRSSPCGTAWKNSLSCSKVGGSTTSVKGLAEIWSTSTPRMLLMTCGSIWNTCPSTVDWRTMPLSSSCTISKCP